MGQRCSCDEECAPGTAIGVFQKPKGNQVTDPGTQGDGGLAEVSRPHDLKDPSATSAAKILKPPRVEADDATTLIPIQTQESAQKVAAEVAKDAGGRSDDVFVFEASLTRDAPQGDLGMKFLREEGIPGVLVVAGIRDGGPAASWNTAQANSGQAELSIRRGDRILAVNGQPCDREPDPSLQQEGTLALALQRWRESYEIKLRRESADDKLGMKLELVERVDGARILRIGQVRGGLLAAWNVSAAAAGRLHEVVSPGTEVLKVGSLGGCPEDMMTALQEGDVELALRRPDPRIIERSAADRAAAGPDAKEPGAD